MKLQFTSMACAALALCACGDSTEPAPPPTQLSFTTQPGNDTVGSALSMVEVAARDAQGTFALGFTGAVTVALAANPGGATLSGTVTVNAVGGVARFTDLSVNKGEDGYTLSATSGTLTVATSAVFDVSEVVQRLALNYYRGLDLETGGTGSCTPICGTGSDFYIAYNSAVTPHGVVVQQSSRQIVHLAGRAFAGVHLPDTAGVTFSSSASSQPFDDTHTILLRTNSGNIYKLGNAAEFGPNGTDSVRFNFARLN